VVVERSTLGQRFAVAVVVFVSASGVARAQMPGGCWTAAPRAIGVSLGRSSPYLELSRGATGSETTGSVLVHSGLQLAGRLDLPVAGPWRARFEGAGAGWQVVEQFYGSGGEPVASGERGRVSARQAVAMFGRQGGRSPVCGYVLAGAGLYLLDYRGASLTRPGFALTAGVEIPAGGRNAIQAELQLHVINTRTQYPIAATDVPAAAIMIGWSRRF
jgi:hypothetical protein